MKKLRILTIIFGAVCALTLTSCGAKSYSASELFEPYVSGFDGSGTFHMSLNSEMEKQILNECMPDDASEMEELIYYALLEGISYDAEPEENLSNGDKVKIKLKYNEDAFAEKKIKFTDTEFTYTVEGLEEAVTIDLMKDVSVTFEGLYPDGEAKIEYTGSDKIIKNNVSYSYTGEVKNGGSIMVKASYLRAAFEKNNYIADEATAEKEFTVSGLDEYLHEKVDFSDIDVLLDERMNEAFNESKYAVGNNIDSMSFLASKGKRWVNYVVKDCTIKPVGQAFIYSDDRSLSNHMMFSSRVSNQYVRFYKTNIDVEKTSRSPYDDGNEIGYKTTGDDIYYAVYISDIIVNGNGELSYSKDDIHYICYDAINFISYLGVEFSTVHDKFIEDTGGTQEIIFDEEIN